jgi:hypothetical protein
MAAWSDVAGDAAVAWLPNGGPTLVGEFVCEDGVGRDLGDAADECE